MKNFVAKGESLQIAAPSGGVVGGAVVKIGSIIGIAVADAAEGEQVTVSIAGAYSDVPKAAAEAWTTGDTLYLKADGSSFTKTATSNVFAGYAYADAASADVLGSILLSH